MSTPVSESFSDEELLGRGTTTDTGDAPVPVSIRVRVRVGVAPVQATLRVDDAAVHRLARVPPVLLPKLPDPLLQEVAPCIRPAAARKQALHILDPLMLCAPLACC